MGRFTIVRVLGQLEEVSHVFDASALGADICVFLLLSAFDTIATFQRRSCLETLRMGGNAL